MFLRSMEAGLQPPLPMPAIDVPKTDPCWSLILHGWEWTILHSSVEARFPSLPATLQMGLNSNNVISKICNEIECGCQLAELHKLGYSLADSLKRMKTTDNHCQPYLDAISHYVSRYSGGTDMPLMAFLGKWGFLFEWYLVLLFPPSAHVGSRYFSVQACWLKTLLCASLLATWCSIHKPFKNIFVGLLPPNTTSSSQESWDVHSSLVRSL